VVEEPPRYPGTRSTVRPDACAPAAFTSTWAHCSPSVASSCAGRHAHQPSDATGPQAPGQVGPFGPKPVVYLDKARRPVHGKTAESRTWVFPPDARRPPPSAQIILPRPAGACRPALRGARGVGPCPDPGNTWTGPMRRLGGFGGQPALLHAWVGGGPDRSSPSKPRSAGRGGPLAGCSAGTGGGD